MSRPTTTHLNSAKDRYRPIFCDSSFYKEHQGLFLTYLNHFKKLTLIEKVQAWVTLLSLLRRPDDWFGGLRKVSLTDSIVQHSLNMKQLLELCHIKYPNKLDPEMNLIDFLNHVKIKALPESSLRSLIKMTNQEYPVQIIFDVPSPQKLLEYQLKGVRIISFNEEVETWDHTLYHGRDFLSFMLHDLIHADHFFCSHENRTGQLGFYRCIEKIIDHSELKDLLLKNEFETGFEYIISDMNSHPVHLFKTLHAKVLQTTNDINKTDSIWNLWIKVWSNQNLEFFSALQKVNTQLFSDTDALAVESHSIALGHTSG